LLPLLAFALARWGRRSTAIAAGVLVALAAVSFAFWWAHVHRLGPGADTRWTYSLPVTFFNFVPGMLLALLRCKLAARPEVRLPPADLMLGAGVACWAASAITHERWGQPLLAVGSGLIVAAVVLPVKHGRLIRFLDLRVLGVLGLASYSLYLWHLPILVALFDRAHPLLTLSVGAVASVAAALVSYALIERPFLRWRRGWGSTLPSASEPELRPPGV
jgi:peptidoglycan/LPS O-acetylase OafA/YrhL